MTAAPAPAEALPLDSKDAVLGCMLSFVWGDDETSFDLIVLFVL